MQTSHLFRILALLLLAGGGLGETPIEKLKRMRKQIQEMDNNIKSIYQVTLSRDKFLVTFKEFDAKWDQRLKMFRDALFYHSKAHETFRYIVDKFKRRMPQGANTIARCALLGGYPAEIENRNQHKFIKSFLGEQTYETGDWIYTGGNNYWKHEDWYGDVKGLRIVAFWARYYPTDGEDENCMSLEYRLEWDVTNAYCNDKISRTLCEIPEESWIS